MGAVESADIVAKRNGADGQAAPVAIVIPSWNSADLLPRCLQSIRRQDLEAELLVVDNGSADGTLEYLRREGVPHVSLPENAGFAAAVNLGASRVAAPAVLVLNVDTELEPGCLAALHEALAADRSLGGVQPRILQLEPGAAAAEARLYSAGQALTADGRALEEGAGEAQGPQALRRREIFGACGAACLLRRELFDDLGGYDESYFAFYEDVDLNVRARIAHWRFEYVPEAAVWHLGNATWLAGAERPSAWNARLVARNRIVTQAKFIPLARLPRILAIEAGSLLRAARQQRLRATARGKLEGLGRLRQGLRERRRLAAAGDLGLARRWLGVRASARPG